MAVNTHPAAGAALTFNSLPIGGIIDATVTLTIETTDVTEVGLLDRKYVSGIRAGSASGNIFFDKADTGQAAMRGAVKSGTAAVFSWTDYSGTSYSVSALVTSFGHSIAVADVVKASFELQFVGEVTIA